MSDAESRDSIKALAALEKKHHRYYRFICELDDKAALEAYEDRMLWLVESHSEIDYSPKGIDEFKQRLKSKRACGKLAVLLTSLKKSKGGLLYFFIFWVTL